MAGHNQTVLALHPGAASTTQSTSQTQPTGPTEPTDNLSISEAFLKLPNTIADNLPGFTPSQFAIYSCLFRHSWGFGRNYCRLSMRAIARHTNMSLRNAWYRLKALKTQGWIILYEKNYRRGNLYVIRIPSPPRAPPPFKTLDLDPDRKPSRDGKVRIIQGREPRQPMAFLEWDAIRDDLAERFPVLYSSFAWTSTQKGVLHVKVSSLHPEWLGEDLRALQPQILSLGFHTIKIWK